MKYPIGVLDYGIGGMGLVKSFQKKFPDCSFLYFSDSGHIPYGKLSVSELSDRVGIVIDRMLEMGCQHIVVACHSASSVVEKASHITSMIQCTIDSVVESKKHSIGIIGGKRTIESNIYKIAIEPHGILVNQEVAQELSILIERGIISGPQLIQHVNRIMEPLKSCQAILLACTHYPAISSYIKKAASSNCILIDPCDKVLDSVIQKIKIDHLQHSKFLTTGDTQLMKMAAYKVFGVKIESIEQIHI